MNATQHARKVTQIRIADPDLCTAACREIYNQRPRWRARQLNGQPTFYTLGAASYLDLGFRGQTMDEYLSDAGSLRSWAGEAVLTMMERVQDALAEHLGAPVEYAPALPSPGFHIFIGRAIPRGECARHVADCGSSHCDMQYQHIPWERWYAAIDREDTISFTLPLRLPVAGGGLVIQTRRNGRRDHRMRRRCGCGLAEFLRAFGAGKRGCSLLVESFRSGLEK